jgi:hypothetical protein
MTTLFFVIAQDNVLYQVCIKSRIMKALSIAAVIVLLFAAPADAQRPGRGRVFNPDRLYNTATVTTVQGTVKSISYPLAKKGRSSGTHLELASASGLLDVHLGPSWYLREKGLSLIVGDKIEVTGSKVTQLGKAAIIAKSVTKEGNTLLLRNDSGIPVWSGRP